jgi:hypothetical protein
MAKEWKIGSTKTITWDFTDVLSDVKIELSRNNGSTWSNISASATNDGSYDWVVTGPESTQAIIRISGLVYTDPIDGSTIDFSDVTDNSEAFSILVSAGSNTDVSCTLNGLSVHMLKSCRSGNIVYINSSNELIVAHGYIPPNATPLTVATGCTIN